MLLQVGDQAGADPQLDAAVLVAGLRLADDPTPHQLGAPAVVREVGVLVDREQAFVG